MIGVMEELGMRREFRNIRIFIDQCCMISEYSNIGQVEYCDNVIVERSCDRGDEYSEVVNIVV